jgi:hypothetical protein
MPDPALPIPRATPLPGTVPLRREYRDPLGRPMTGSVVLTGRSTAGGGYAPAPVTVAVPAGVLEVDLPPDTYEAAATLRTVDGVRVSVRDTITLEGETP